jgi:hypothetical protein
MWRPPHGLHGRPSQEEPPFPRPAEAATGSGAMLPGTVAAAVRPRSAGAPHPGPWRPLNLPRAPAITASRYGVSETNGLGLTRRCLGRPVRAVGCVSASRGSRVGCGPTSEGVVQTHEGTRRRFEPGWGLRGEVDEQSAGKTKSARLAAGVIRHGGRGPFHQDFKGAWTLLRDDAGAIFRGTVEVGC